LNIGAENKKQAENVASAVASLATQNVVSWDSIAVAMTCFFDRIEDIQLDSPHVEDFAHMLLARLFALEYDVCLLKALPQSELSYDLLLGALRKAKEHFGVQKVKWIVNANEFAATMAQAKGIPPGMLKAKLRRAGLFECIT